MKTSFGLQWWRPAIALLLLAMTAGLDQMIGREHWGSSISPLADFVDKFTATQREAQQLRAQLDDPASTAAAKLQAAEKLLKLLGDGKPTTEARQTARAAVSQLVNQIDLTKLIVPCQKLLTSPSDQVWLLEQWRCNVLAVTPPAEQAARLVTIAEQAASLHRDDLALALIKDAMLHWSVLSGKQQVGLLQRLSPMLLAVDSKSQVRYGKLAPVLRRVVSENWRSWWPNPVPPNVVDSISGWYRVAARSAKHAATAQWALELLDEVCHAAGNPPPLLYLIAQYRARLVAGNGEAELLQRLEDALLPQLQASAGAANPVAAHLVLLQQIYQRRNMTADAEALQVTLDKYGATKQQTAEAIKRMQPLLKALRNANWPEATRLYASLDLPPHLPAVRTLAQIMALVATANPDMQAPELPNPLPAAEQAAVLGLGSGPLAILYLETAIGARDRGQSGAALLALAAAERLYGQSNPHMCRWIARERWFLQGQNSPPPVPLHQVPYKVGAINLDGVLDEAVYQQVVPVDRFLTNIGSSGVNSPTPAELATRVWLWHDNQWLYIAVEALEPDMAGAVMQHRDHDSEVWRDDSFEFFTTGNRQLRNYEQWCLNALGGIQELEHTQLDFSKGNITAVPIGGDTALEFNPRTQSAGSRAAAAWRIEARIAMADIPNLQIPVHGKVLTANMRRLRYGRGKHLIYQTWSPCDGQYHSIENFQLLRFE